MQGLHEQAEYINSPPMDITIKALAPAGPSTHEAFDKAVLHRPAGSDIVPFNMGLLASFEDRHTGHLRAVIGNSSPWLASPVDEGVQLPGKANARQRCVRDETQAFAGEAIYDTWKRRPSMKASLMKSGLQRSMGREGKPNGRLVLNALSRLPRLRTVSFSSR